MIKEIKTQEDYVKIEKTNKTIVKYGIPNCIPCKFCEDNLKELSEQDYYKDWNIYLISDVDICLGEGIEHPPVIYLYINDNVIILEDNSTMMDVDELDNWIKEQNE